MKYRNYIIIVLLFALFSCQKEETEIIEPNEEEHVLPNSFLANLLTSISLKDGSDDNIIDSTSNLTVHFPIEVSLNNSAATSISSVAEIEAQIQSYTDSFETIFPITVTTYDYQEIEIENNWQLNSLAQQEMFINDNECIDLQYPISFSAFNIETEAFETIVIENDEDLFNLLMNMSAEVLLSIDFPINVTLYDGSSMTINSNSELLAAIEGAIGSCDEDDDSYNQDSIPVILENCQWIFSETANGGTVIFNPDGTLEGYNTNTVYFTGTWNLQLGNTDVLTMDVPEANVAIEGAWVVTGFSAANTGYLISFDENGQELYLLQDCEPENECSTTVTECEIGTEVGYAGFLLSEQDLCMVQLAGMELQTSIVAYFVSEMDAQNNTNQIISTQTYVNTVQFSQYIYVRVENVNTGEYEILVILLVTEDC